MCGSGHSTHTILGGRSANGRVANLLSHDCGEVTTLASSKVKSNGKAARDGYPRAVSETLASVPWRDTLRIRGCRVWCLGPRSVARGDGVDA